MGKVVINILPVGQGAMNLIEGYDDLNRLQNLILIDFGSTPSPSALEVDESHVIDNALFYVRNKISERKSRDDSALWLDALVVTHKDEDHYNLARRLFTDSFKTEDVGNVFCSIVSKQYKTQYRFYRSGNGMFCYRTNDYILSNSSHLGNMILVYSDADGFYMKYNDFYKDSSNCLVAEIGPVKSQQELKITYSTKFNATPNDKRVLFSRVDENRYIYISNGTEIKRSDMRLKDRCQYPNHYEECRDWVAKVIEAYVGFDGIERLNKLFGIMSGDFYKDRNEVDALAADIPSIMYKPIGICFIGGETAKSAGDIDMLKRLSNRVVTECDANKDILTFGNRTSKLRILCHYDEKIMASSFVDLQVPSLNNAASAVSLFYDGNNKFVFPGDATRHTIYLMREQKDPYKLLGNAYWTAPHHGASITMTPAIRYNHQQHKIYEYLLIETSIQKMIVSAGYVNTYGHPCSKFVTKFEEIVGQQVSDPMHDICVNNNNNALPNSEWVHKYTTAPIYTSLMCHGGEIAYCNHVFQFIANNQTPPDHEIKPCAIRENKAYSPTAAQLKGTSKGNGDKPMFGLFFSRI